MIYIQVKDGLVVNSIVLDDEELIPVFSKDFDDFLRIDQDYPSVGVEWKYDGKEFSTPDSWKT